MPDVLIVKPLGGLANRIRAVTCGMWCARELGLELIVSWEQCGFMPAAFSELFTNKLTMGAGGQPGRTSAVLDMAQLIAAKLIIDRSLLNDPGIEVIEIRTGVAFSHRPEISPWAPDFGDTIRPFLHALTPVEPVTAEVTEHKKRFSPRMLGVHVRTGRGNMGYHSYIDVDEEQFYEIMDRAVGSMPDLGLYVASDFSQTVDGFKQRYGSRVITLSRGENDIARRVDTVEDIRSALVELILLGQTHWMLGTLLSSYSEVAGWYKRRSFSALGSVRRERVK